MTFANRILAARPVKQRKLNEDFFELVGPKGEWVVLRNWQLGKSYNWIAYNKANQNQVTDPTTKEEALRIAKRHVLEGSAGTLPEVKFIVKNEDLLTSRIPSLGKDFQRLNPREGFDWLNKMAYIKGSGVSIKVGNNSFRDKVDVNTALKSNKAMTVRIEKRKGYRLVTYTFVE